MDPTAVTVIVVVAVVLVVVGLVALLARRKEAEAQREHLQERFGPEYDRAVADADDQRQAEARLAEAERRRDELDVRPLTAESRDRRISQWESVQAMFVDAPVEATDGAGRLVDDVMSERGYPAADDRDRLSLLAADHAETVESYRSAEALRHRFHTGEGSTEDLRRAFVEYRRLFEVLVHEGVDRVDHRTGDRADLRSDDRLDQHVDDRTDDRVETVDLRDDQGAATHRHVEDQQRSTPRDGR
jgi:hypothetical protein